MGSGGTHLLLQQSKFESRRSLKFFSIKFVLKRTKINKKRPGLPHFFKKSRAGTFTMKSSHLVGR